MKKAILDHKLNPKNKANVQAKERYDYIERNPQERQDTSSRLMTEAPVTARTYNIDSER
jgi:hypothetical protein